MQNPPRGRLMLFYALPALALGLPTIPVYIYLPTLYASQPGLSLAAIGGTLLAARLFDTLSDPLAGFLSDRFPLGGNYRKPWIAAGALLGGAGLFHLLTPPADAGAGYLMLWSVILYAGWTLVSVPYLAWGAELVPGYHDRTRITAWREGLGILGIAAAGLLGAVATGGGGSEREAATLIAWCTVIAGSLTIPVLLWRVPDAGLNRPRTGMARRPDWRGQWRSLMRNRLFMRLLSAWFVNGLANGIPAVLFFLYMEHALGIGEQGRSLMVLLYFLSAIAAMPLWTAASRRFGKHRVWCWAMLAACTAFAAVPFLSHGNETAFAVICIITGVALGADLALPPAIQADVADHDSLRCGHARTGLLFALWSMASKLALAAAAGLALGGAQLLGFDPAVPTGSGIMALTGIYALVPLAIKLAAIALMWRFPLTAARHDIIRRRLAGGRVNRQSRKGTFT